jgi:putative tryptophan/tyrosine transport system substrate-binding protein
VERRHFLQLVGGALAAAPTAALSQTTQKIPTVAYLWHAGNPSEESPYYEAVLEGFAKLGYVEGRNIRLIHRFPDEKPERFKAMAQELVAMNVDVLMSGSLGSGYLRDVTKTIPIVFMFVPDPVGMKLAKTLARPGGNATGLSNFGSEIAGKRLQLLKELVPGLARVGFLINPTQQTTQVYVDVMSGAAKELGLTLALFEARTMEEMEPALDAMVKAGMQAMVPAQGGTAFQARHVIPKLALARGIAMCAFSKETFEAGALISYGPNQLDMCRRSAVYVDKILKGTAPGDIPVEQPTTFELLINMKTAKALGVTVPLHLQQIANEVVE